MAAAALAGTPLTSHSCFSSSTALHSFSWELRRQVWHHSVGKVIAGHSRLGKRVLAADIEDGSEKQDSDASSFQQVPDYTGLNFCLVVSTDGISTSTRQPMMMRRQLLSVPAVSICAYFLSTTSVGETASAVSGFTDMPALRGKDYGKTKMKYPDYVETESGLQYKDLRAGVGPAPEAGSIVVVDWDGYTIGYYGRIFEARNKAKGGSFEGDQKGYFRFKLGSDEVIPAFEEAVATMQVGGVRRIIVPPELGYPDNDYNRKGPRPTTFSGQRALDFVLRNQGLIDKTLLFDIELLRVATN